MATKLSDIAKQANVSPTTVSRVLNGREGPFVSEATRVRIQALARELGYRPNSIARALATGRTHLVGFWYPWMRHSLFAKVVRHLQDILRGDGYEVVIREHWPKRDPAGDMPETGPWIVDGIVAYGRTLPIRAILDAGPPVTSPLVNIGRPIPGYGDCVEIDLYPAAMAAMQHLLTSGRSRIAFMSARAGPKQAKSASPGRLEAYEQSLEAAGRAPERIYLRRADVSSDSRDVSRMARHTVKDHVQGMGCPEAIFCQNDEIAIGAYRGLRDLGLRIPADVALVGCDGIAETEYLDTPLTTIVQPVEEATQLAWQFLRRRMAEPGIPEQRAVLPGRLLIRESSGDVRATS